MRRSPALLVAAALAAGLAPRLARAEDAAAAPAVESPADTSTPAASPTSTPAATSTSAATPTATATPTPTPTPTATATTIPPATAAPTPTATTIPPATAAEPPADPSAVAAPQVRGLGREELPRFGLSLGGGFPDLANASFLFRPVRWARLYAGPCWGYVAWGLQGGVVLAPWNGVATPTLSFQAGELFSSNLTRFVKSDSQSAQDVKPLLARVDYRYLAADLGLELGSPRGFNFYLRLGLSFLVLKANGTATHVADDGTRVTVRDPSLRAWMPSLKLGFQYWL